MLTLTAGKAEACDRRRRVTPQPIGKIGIAPRLRHHLRAVARPNLRLIGLDDTVDRRRVDQTLFRQQRLKRLHPRLHVGIVIVVVVMIVVIVRMLVGHSRLPSCPDYFNIGQRLSTSSTAMVMLNHLSRTGSESQSRSAEPNPAQVDTLGRLTAANANPTRSTVTR